MGAPGGSTTPATNLAGATGRAPGLEGLASRIAVRVGDKPAGAFDIDDDGMVTAAGDASGATATIVVDSEETLGKLLRGETPPLVIWLQGRLHMEGDVVLGLRVLLGLQAGSPWAAAARS